MIALEFFSDAHAVLSSSSSLHGSATAAVGRRLQPWLRRRHALFPTSDLVGVLEGQADIVETFEQAHAVGGRNVERDVGAAGPADASASSDRP